jgi:hypothetical protein
MEELQQRQFIQSEAFLEPIPLYVVHNEKRAHKADTFLEGGTYQHGVTAKGQRGPAKIPHRVALGRTEVPILRQETHS